jgi:hypothetical protein
MERAYVGPSFGARRHEPASDRNTAAFSALDAQNRVGRTEKFKSRLWFLSQPAAGSDFSKKSWRQDLNL